MEKYHIERTCPKCQKRFTEYPAISRRDGSEICSECGIKEAVEDFERFLRMAKEVDKDE